MEHSKIRGFIGTCFSPDSRGIYTFTFDKKTGELSAPKLFYPAPDCKYLSLHKGLLAAPVRRGNKSGICLIDLGIPGGGFGVPGGSAPEPDADGHAGFSVREVLTESVPACYVTQDDDFIYTANYHEGTALVYHKTHKTGDAPQLVKVIENGRGAGCHQVLFYGPYLMTPCLLQDRIRFFDRTKDYALAGELIFPEKSGPRHGVFDKAQKRFFVVSELSNQIFVLEIAETRTGEKHFMFRNRYDILAGSFPPTPEAHLSEAPIAVFSAPVATPAIAGVPAPVAASPDPAAIPAAPAASPAPASAAIRLSPDEHYLCVSTRFADCITVFKVEGTSLTLCRRTGSGGKVPRDFIFTRDGNFLITVNQKAGGLAAFPVNPQSENALPLCSRVPMAEGVSVVLEE